MKRGVILINSALIIFVIIAVSLGVILFVFYKKCEESLLAKTQIASAVEMKNNDIISQTHEIEKLKIMLVGTPEKSIDDVRTQYTSDMAAYAENFDKNNQSYSKVLSYLYNQIETQNFTLAANDLDIKDLTEYNKNRDKFNTVKTASIEALSKDIASDKDERIRALQSMIADLEANSQLVTDTVTGSDAKNKKAVDELTKNLESLVDLIKTNIRQTVAIRGQMESKVAQASETHDGLIQFASAATGTASINLGQADGLNLKTTFTVYSADTTDMANGKKKGSIEVVQVSGEHVADCRIIEDSLSNPIIPGDKIYSPVWDPGFQERFAIVGFIDFDGDGTSDLHKLINLIQSNGGVVDAYQDGDKQVRTMTEKTSNLIVGERPDDKSSESALLTYQNFIQDAKDYGTKEVKVKELLARMGYDPQRSSVTRYEGGSAENFRAQPRDGIIQKSGQPVSALFLDDERKPQTAPTTY